ncbi:unnamed protein product [Nippostrongylus brasiliensis]|uniref:Tubulin-specific chaperone E n=1 Tax=Nippostrongylus brasiliensis TaxID=27835 RepID=A0A0N4YUH3_NIPBR|nr:unnamed protein product [Nippostrongylus brasiliensis]
MLKLGDRVSVNGHAATVRYIGDVSGHPGQWVGVEWDDPNRGKHDGVVGDVRYFSTRSPKGGSLVKIENVKAGVDLLTAVLNRYADDIDENLGVVSHKTVVLVGMQSTSVEQSKIHDLSHIVLESCLVSAPPPETCAPFRRCTTLNLYNNLLFRWEDVRAILRFFPRIRELVLSLEKLSVNDCGIREIVIHIGQFPSLTMLNIRNNKIPEWSSINQLQSLPKLSVLYIDCDNLCCAPNIDVHEVCILFHI